jgi:hypothetical protein
VIDRENVQWIDRAVEAAIAAGAKALVRGGPIQEGPLAKGAFYRDNKMDIVQEETFGSVMTLQTFGTEAEQCNWRMTTSTASQPASGRATSIGPFVSTSAERRDHLDQWSGGGLWRVRGGGFKQSGLGRMNGMAVMNDFIEYQHITVTTGVLPQPIHAGWRRNAHGDEGADKSHERFTSIDQVTNDGLNITGQFHSDQWGDFRTYFNFHLSSSGKIVRLDIGQAS